ncbi:tRNA pseudouridine(38-40) synthase TruA [Propionibacterium cyclohexanicum]|uniref:tRNA pseudouridine(38-40) synthase TruA n=1 Tax=Propionibacterium cyclohexanicum TaxID=64702 RepID=UPI003CCB84C9
MTTRRLRLDIGYDGSGFRGWAAQPGQRTVQGLLTEWIDRLVRNRPPTQLVVAGRTDAGVHARGQVAHIDLPLEVDPDDLGHRLARVLPPDVVVTRVSVAPADFDARFAALWRRYVYRLWDDNSVPDPLVRHHVVRVPGSLDPQLMTMAGSRLLGLRDFVAFSKHRDGATTIRTLLECRAGRGEDRCHGVELTVRADAFCHSMVRSLTGALVAVGSGRRPLDWIDEVASSTRRHGAVRVMPAAGLCLEEVAYPPPDQLATRVGQSRAVRSLAPDYGCRSADRHASGGLQ